MQLPIILTALLLLIIYNINNRSNTIVIKMEAIKLFPQSPRLNIEAMI